MGNFLIDTVLATVGIFAGLCLALWIIDRSTRYMRRLARSTDIWLLCLAGGFIISGFSQ